MGAPNGENALETVRGLSEEELDALPFGAIRLDREGTVVAYNKAESELSGCDPAWVVGRNFFTEVAPCANVRAFGGRFRAGVEAGSLFEVFPFRFEFTGGPREVWVTLFFDAGMGVAWVLVHQRGG